MATLKSAIQLYDGMSPALRSMNKVLGIVLSSFESLQKASNNAIDTETVQAARDEYAKMGALIDEIENNIKNSDVQQNEFNQSIKNGTSAAGGLLDKIKSVAAAYLGMKGINWVKDSLNLYDTQNNVDTQLKTVLKNVGAASDAYSKIQAKASELQSKTAYGDEALIGGAAEFATYMSDENAIASMMETLTNYAAGMSGGGEVDVQQMVDYATGLGKVMTGSYDAMTKKGFEFTDQQKAIIENGTDMQKALVISDVINESWEGLAERMANTPIGRIQQLKNAFGDIREEFAAEIYPAVMNFFDAIQENSDNIKNLIVGLSGPINIILNLLANLIKLLSTMYNFTKKNWSKIGPIVYGIAAAMTAYNTALLVHKVYLKGAALAQKMKTIAEYAHAKSILATAAAYGIDTQAIKIKAVEDKNAAIAELEKSGAAKLAAANLTAEEVATSGATVAQMGFNSALYACPLVWILAIILLVAAALLLLWENCEGFRKFFTNMINKFVKDTLWLYNNILVPFSNWFLQAQNDVRDVLTDVFDWIINAVFNVYAFLVDKFKSFAKLAKQTLSIYNQVASVFKKETINIDLVTDVEKIEEARENMLNELHSWSRNEDFHQKIPEDEAYQKIDEFTDRIKDFTIKGWLTDKWKGVEDGLANGSNALEKIQEGVDYISNSLDMTEEDLQYLRDIAEREAINRFTTAQITIEQTNNNTINSDMDIDGVIDRWNTEFTEVLETAAEGVYE